MLSKVKQKPKSKLSLQTLDKLCWETTLSAETDDCSRTIEEQTLLHLHQRGFNLEIQISTKY